MAAYKSAQTQLKVLWTWKSGEGLAAQTLIIPFVCGLSGDRPLLLLLQRVSIQLFYVCVGALEFHLFLKLCAASLCIWMLLLPVVFAKVVARWVALFQCLSYRQLDIACQQRQQLQLWQGSNNPGKVNTQSTKHLFTAITEIFLHSTWH